MNMISTYILRDFDIFVTQGVKQSVAYTISK